MRLIDCGVELIGSIEAGRRLAEICLAGLGTVYVKQTDTSGPITHQVHVTTSAPVAACMASQYAGWTINPEGYFAMGSGPLRARARVEKELFGKLGYGEDGERRTGAGQDDRGRAALAAAGGHSRTPRVPRGGHHPGIPAAGRRGSARALGPGALCVP